MMASKLMQNAVRTWHATIFLTLPFLSIDKVCFLLVSMRGVIVTASQAYGFNHHMSSNTYHTYKCYVVYLLALCTLHKAAQLHQQDACITPGASLVRHLAHRKDRPYLRTQAIHSTIPACEPDLPQHRPSGDSQCVQPATKFQNGRRVCNTTAAIQ